MNTLKQVKVLDDKNVPYIEFTISNIDKKPTFDDEYFKLEKVAKEYQVDTENTKDNSQKQNENKNQDSNNTKQDSNNTKQDNNEQTEEQQQGQEITTKEEATSSLEDSLFPFYLPTNTSLSNKETIQTENGQRMI